jgi:hypothetical protein
MNWLSSLSREFVDRFDLRFRQVSAAGRTRRNGWMDQGGTRTDPPSHLAICVYYGGAEERVICFFENKNVRKSVHESYNYHLYGDRDGKGKDWVLVMKQTCKYAYTQSIRRFVLCDYICWAFVEIDTVDRVTHEFDYEICWRKWSDSGRLQRSDGAWQLLFCLNSLLQMMIRFGARK